MGYIEIDGARYEYMHTKDRWTGRWLIAVARQPRPGGSWAHARTECVPGSYDLKRRMEQTARLAAAIHELPAPCAEGPAPSVSGHP